MTDAHTEEINAEIQSILNLRTKCYIESSWSNPDPNKVKEAPDLYKSYRESYGNFFESVFDPFMLESLQCVSAVKIYLTNRATRLEIIFDYAINVPAIQHKQTHQVYWTIEPTQAGKFKMVYYNPNLLDRY